MRAIVKRGPYPGAEVADIPIPSVTAGQVLLRIGAASVCGTDLSLVRWTQSAQDFNPVVPLVLGHEVSGRIVEVGHGVQGLTVGQQVAVESHYFCGKCAACIAGALHNCLRMVIPGIHAPGGFAEYMAVPASACFLLDDDVDPVVGALYEPAGVAVHAIEQAGPVAGRMIALTGAGPVGLFLVALLRAAGAAHIAVVEPEPRRRQRAEELGAEVFGTDDVEAFAKFCRDRGSIAGADIAFEVSGAAPAYETIFDALGRDATLISVGHTSERVPIDVSRDVNKRVVTWKGVFGRRIWSSWEYLDTQVRDGVLDLTSFVEVELGLDELAERFDDVASLQGKVVVRP